MTSSIKLLGTLIVVPVVAVLAWTLVGPTDSTARRPRTTPPSKASLVVTEVHEPQSRRLNRHRPASEDQPLQAVKEKVAPEATEDADVDIETELEHRFQSDVPSSRGTEIESEVLAGFDGHGRLETVECKSKTCRIEASFENADEEKSLFESFFLSDDYKLGMAGTVSSRHVEEDGRVSFRLYLYEQVDPGFE
ncbi:MAG: hypothetical protein MK135_03795 [Polyangiaceae bacterium]|nr:hypothetical protein [Polyangiaceae bacterium]